MGGNFQYFFASLLFYFFFSLSGWQFFHNFSKISRIAMRPTERTLSWITWITKEKMRAQKKVTDMSSAGPCVCSTSKSLPSRLTALPVCPLWKTEKNWKLNNKFSTVWRQSSRSQHCAQTKLIFRTVFFFCLSSLRRVSFGWASDGECARARASVLLDAREFSRCVRGRGVNVSESLSFCSRSYAGACAHMGICWAFWAWNENSGAAKRGRRRNVNIIFDFKNKYRAAATLTTRADQMAVAADTVVVGFCTNPSGRWSSIGVCTHSAHIRTHFTLSFIKIYYFEFNFDRKMLFAPIVSARIATKHMIVCCRGNFMKYFTIQRQNITCDDGNDMAPMWGMVMNGSIVSLNVNLHNCDVWWHSAAKIWFQSMKVDEAKWKLNIFTLLVSQHTLLHCAHDSSSRVTRVEFKKMVTTKHTQALRRT